MKFSLLLSLLFLVSCASTTPGIKIDSGNQDVSIFVSKDATYSNERIQMLHFAIKNNSDEWFDFEGAKVESGEFDVLVGERLDAWIQACTLEKRVSDHNTAVALGVLAAAGGIVAATSNHQSTANIGAVVALGSISALAVKDMQKSIKWAEMQFAFPEDHVFRSFSLPPKKAIHRWIVIENDPSVFVQFKATTKDKKRSILLNN